MNEKKEYYSNCLIEALKAKIKWGKQVKIIYIPSWKNDVYCPHFMWHDWEWGWLMNRSKRYAATFGYVGGSGNAANGSASYAFGVRPAFLII